MYVALKNSCFSLSDFEVVFPESGNEFAKIVFKHVDNYRFTIVERKETESVKVTQGITSVFAPVREERNTYIAKYVIASPGNYKMEDKIEIDDFDDALSLISKWCDNIKADISTQFEEQEISDEIESFRKQLEDELNQNIINANERFSETEIETLNAKFDDLYAKFEHLKEENKLTEKELDKIKKELAEIKSTAKSFPRGIWAKVTHNKLFEIMIDFVKSKEGREFIIDGVKRLLTK